MKCDTTTLTQIINKCFDLSMDGRVTDEKQRSEFLALGKRLRGSLLNLLSAQFDDGTKAVEDANTSLTKINSDLADEANALNNLASTITNITTLVGTLDKLIGVAGSFV
jgi:hypothetical protein